MRFSTDAEPTFPRFRAASIKRFMPAAGAPPDYQRAGPYWAWVANSYRYRGFTLAECVRVANQAVREAARENEISTLARAKTRKRDKQRREQSKPKPSKRLRARLQVSPHVKRTHRRIAERERKAELLSRLRSRLQAGGDPGG